MPPAETRSDAATPTAKPNQQLRIQQQQAEQLQALADRDDAAVGLGARARAAWRAAALDGSSLPPVALPLIAIETTFSLLRGTGSPVRWGRALAGLHAALTTQARDRRGANHPTGLAPRAAILAAQGAIGAPTDGDTARANAAAATARALAEADADHALDDDAPWALLADRDDLLGLPAALDAIGRQRLGVGATLALGDGDDGVVVVAAPDEAAYGRLCRLLSWRLEEADAWRRWRDGDDGALPLRLDGVVALVRDARVGARLAARGAECWWRADARPWQGAAPFPVAAVPLIAHLDGDDALAAPVLAAIRARATVAPPRARDAAPTTLAGLGAMRVAYAGYEDQLASGRALAARLRYVPGGDPPPLHVPAWPADHDADAELAELAAAGLVRRYGEPPPAEARARLAHELAVIRGKRFASYILTVHQIAKDKRTCGRGSAASSVVCYALGLTNVDPVKYHLLFERFLAPERIDPPDIDIDFAWDERDAVIGAALARYGREHTAMVATHQCMHQWAALREAARAFGQGEDAIAKARQRLHDAQAYGGRARLDPPWPAIVAAAQAIGGAPRHLGLHCGGFIVCARPVRELVPVHPAAKTIDGVAVPTIAWEKDGAEALGFVKIDLLGNRSLAVVRDCLADLREDGEPLDERSWRPQDDWPTQELLATGATMGCFYIESPAMRQLQAKVGSGDFDRLVVHSSIIRPAAGAFIRTYVERYREWRDAGERIPDAKRAEWFPHPALEHLLSESFGVLSYQEDVMVVAQRLAGFGSAEANQLRKALGRSDTAERLQGLIGRFREGCRANAVAEHVIDHVWGMISSFAGYSFTKAHSASYAVVSFECAWLKRHRPAHFLARVIANEGGYYHTGAYVEEARRWGVEVLAPCVVKSAWKTARERNDAIRIGFQHVKGLSRAAARKIEDERAIAPFTGVRDLRVRASLAADELAALADAGALDALTPGLNDAQRRWLTTVVTRDGDPLARGGQQLLALDPERVDPPPPPLPDLDAEERRWRRFAALGFLPEAQALALWKLPWRKWRCRDVSPANVGQRLQLVALNIARKPVVATYRTDERGDALPDGTLRHAAMAFVTLEDETGLAETVWFPEVYQRHGPLLERFAPLRVVGVVEVELGVATLSIQSAEAVGEERGARGG